MLMNVMKVPTIALKLASILVVVISVLVMPAIV